MPGALSVGYGVSVALWAECRSPGGRAEEPRARPSGWRAVCPLVQMELRDGRACPMGDRNETHRCRNGGKEASVVTVDDWLPWKESCVV